MKTRFVVLTLLIILFTAGGAGTANAYHNESTSSNMTVTAIIAAPPPASAISVSSLPVTVSIAPAGGAPEYDFIAGTIVVNLPNPSPTPYKVALGRGNNYENPSRRLAVGGNFAVYFLYQDIGRTIQWGDSGNLDVPSYPAGASFEGTGNQSLPVYGRLTVPNISGLYEDTVLVTIHF